MEILKVDNIVQNYGGLRVLQGVSFSLKNRERLALIGPNGAGKTTLMNVLNGLVPCISGRILMLGRDITHLSPGARACMGIGRSFQITNLFLNLSLLNNLLIAMNGTRPSRFQLFRPITSYKENIAKAKQLLESVELGARSDEPIAALSHGERRRVEVLLAMISNPRLLLLDEPSAGLTRAEANSLMKMISDLTGDAAVLFDAHDMDLVFAFADRIIVLYYGRIIAEGTPQEIKNDSKVREIYLGKSKAY